MLIDGIQNRILVCDLEANGLLYYADKIWCIAAVDYVTNEEFFWGPEEIKAGLWNLMEAKRIVFHNYFGYDRPLIKKLFPKWKEKSADDTLVMSCLFDADRPAPEGHASKHSIEAWGARFGMVKPGHEDWTQFSEDMQHRCLEDTRIGVKVYKQLLNEAKGWNWSQALRLEYKTAQIHGEQILNGVYFDADKAEKLYKGITDKIRDIEIEIYKYLPPKPRMSGSVPVKRPFKNDGSYTKMVTDWMEDESEKVVGPFTKIQWLDINLNSPEQVKDYLLTQGWQPDTWNYKKDGKYLVKDDNGEPIKMSPKLTESSFHTVEGDVPKLITKRMVLKHRAQMIKHTKKDGTKTGWLNSIRPDGRVEAGGLTCGTPTGRYQHRGVVNVPKPTKDKETGELIFDTEKQDPIYGTQLRDLFIPEPGKIMVGCDAVSLETTVQGHYVFNRTNGQKLANSLLDESFKKDLEVTFGKPWKRGKNGYYSLLYGAQVPKFSATLGVDEREGKRILEAFWRDNPGLKELKDDLEAAFQRNFDPKTKRGFIKGLDGRKLWARSKHSLMNLLFQNAGSVIVKTATCFAYDMASKKGLDFKQVIHYHDEIEYELNPQHTEEMKKVLEKAFNRAGEYWNLNLPINGDPVAGYSWAQVH